MTAANLLYILLAALGVYVFCGLFHDAHEEFRNK